MPLDALPARVLSAFGAPAPGRSLPGGQGGSWRAGDLVLKRGGGAVHDWWAEAQARIVLDGVRLADPVRTRDGAWSCEGWTATRWLDGHGPDLSSASGWLAVLRAGRAFHLAVAHLSRPQCLDDRQDPWALADREAWGERSSRLRPELAALGRRLQRALQPLGPSQVVHGDLTGNVLVSTRQGPALLDVSPYWRPTAYAEGVVVADALCRYGAPASVLEDAEVGVPAVARALLFRLATTQHLAHRADDLADQAERYERAVAALGL